jgi:two-component system alkaline phosphatase synthesis response regulator PhoP
MGQEKRALIIEDDQHIIDLLTLHLQDLGFATYHAKSGTEGIQKALGQDHDLIILDLMLPELDGFEVCKRIREENRKVPLLMLTARAEELDKVLGLELGADDYITKPFSIREFIARVKALVRRVETDRGELTVKGPEEVLREGELTIHLTNRTVEKEGRKIELTRKEFDLLALLARNPGRAFNRQQLLDIVWGYQYEGYNHTVNSHINRLRSKIENDPSNPAYIQTVWGYGYRFARKGDKNR